jgi:hypothetical protein
MVKAQRLDAIFYGHFLQGSPQLLQILLRRQRLLAQLVPNRQKNLDQFIHRLPTRGTLLIISDKALNRASQGLGCRCLLQQHFDQCANGSL